MKKALIVGMWLGMALSASAGIIVWDNAGGGVWSAQANWKPNQVPGAGDLAVITNSGNFTVTLDVAADISGLVLGAGDGTTQTFAFNGQTLSLDGVATLNPGGQMDFSSGTFNGDTNTGGAVINGTLTCSGGALAGKFTVASNSVLNLAAKNALSSLVLLTNYGTVNWGNADLVGAGGLQLFNQGLWLAQGNNTFFGNGAVFKNSGTFRKSAIAGVTLFDANTTFNTTGTVELQTNSKLTVQKGNGGGDFLLGSGTILTLGGSNNFELTGSSSFTGTGLVLGKLTGAGGGGVDTTITFSGITFSNTLTIANNGALNLIGNAGAVNLAGILTNYGTVTWSNTDLYSLSGPSTLPIMIHNYGLWTVHSNNVFTGGQGGIFPNLVQSTFNNYGTFRKSAGTGITDVNCLMINSGLVDVQSGTLWTRQIYGTNTPVFNTASNTTMRFPSKPYDYTSRGNTILTGLGTVLGNLVSYPGGSNVVSSGLLTFSNASFSGPFFVASNAAINLIGGFGLSGAQFSNLGTVTCNSGLTNTTSSQIYNYGLWDSTINAPYIGGSGLTFNNHGVFRKSCGVAGSGSTYFDSAVIFTNHEPGLVDALLGVIYFNQIIDRGFVNVESNAIVGSQSFYLSGNPTFAGAGYVEGNLASLTSSNNATISGVLSLTNAGLWGAITIASNAVVNFVSTSGTGGIGLNYLVLTNYGTINWSNLNLSAISSTSYLHNFGLWDAKMNNVISGSYSGQVVFNNHGTFRKSGGALGMGSTYLNNYTAFNNFDSGMVDAQTGRIWLGGPFSLGQGALNCGINSSTDFGTFYLSGTGSLSGVLSVNLNNGFSPALSNAFALVYYPGAIGTFSAMNLPPLSSERMWQPDYGATTFTLSVVSVPSPTLTTPTLTGGNSVTFAWASVPGQVYQVQFTTNLAPVNWLDLGSSITATNTTQSVTDVIGVDPQRFYRVVIP